MIRGVNFVDKTSVLGARLQWGLCHATKVGFREVYKCPWATRLKGGQGGRGPTQPSATHLQPDTGRTTSLRGAGPHTALSSSSLPFAVLLCAVGLTASGPGDGTTPGYTLV